MSLRKAGPFPRGSDVAIQEDKTDIKLHPGLSLLFLGVLFELAY
jgi:hypothetical protein